MKHWSLFIIAGITLVNWNWVAADDKPIQPATSDPRITDYKLAFSDEFDGQKLDESKWDYRTDSKHWSTQKPENVIVENGKLKLMLRKETAGDKSYTGAGIISKNAFKFGYYEARIKCPPGKGWHTSFWMQNHDGSGGTGTKTAEQEIDVCENDSVNLKNYGINLHAWKQKDQFKSTGKGVATPNLSADFHIWGCEFTPTVIRLFFDGKEVGLFDAAGRNFNDQHIWLTSIASFLGKTDHVDDSVLPAAAEYDYIRFFTR